MWELIKHKLTKLGCFALIAVAMILVSALTKFILGWFDFDNHTKDKFSESAGEYFGKGVLGLILLAGFIILVIQLRKESSGKRSKPPSNPPPIPDDRPPPLQTSITKKKGCITALIILSMLPLMGVAMIWYLASEYEKLPKKPGQLAAEQASEFIDTYHGTEGGGNTAEGIELAAEFARNLRVARG